MSLRLRLCLVLLVAPLLLLLLFGVWQLQQDAELRRTALTSRLTDSLALLRDPAAQDPRAEANRLALRLLSLDEVRGATLRSHDGQLLNHVGTVRPVSAGPPRAGLIQHAERWHLQLPLTTRNDPQSPLWLDLTLRDGVFDLAYYRQLTRFMLAWLAAALLLGGLCYLLYRRLFATLDDQRDALQRLYAGDYEFRLRPGGARELTTTSTAINALGEHLQAAQEDMRQQVEQATADLRESMDTIEIQNIELDGARRRALEANRVKSQFLANMSHEIRTPLNGIIGFCRLLGRSQLDDHQREWLKHIEMASTNLLSLINDILDFSKIEAGKLRLASVELDMAELVDEVLVLQAPDAQQKDLQLLSLVYDDVPRALLGDPLRIKQVLTNLVHNAVKFTERGEVIVRVQVEGSLGSKTTLSVRISDTGPGLADDVRQHLFQPFTQSSTVSSSHVSGTGLGLMICKQLVEQMGGDIVADTQPVQGTTFTVSLPLRIAPRAVQRPPAIDLDAVRIAIHEPHTLTRQALAHLLRGWGAEVQILTAPPTAEGLATGTQLVIVALSQGGLGAQVSRLRQQLGTLPCRLLLLVNGEPQTTDEALALPEGARLFYKPLTRTRLAQALKPLLSDTPTALLTHAPLDQEPAPLDQEPGKPWVLAVDDIETNRLLVGELLSQLGVASVLAESGEEALALASGQHFDLVLMDIRMPGMSGLETMTALRRLGGAWAHCPFVALTAHAMPDDSQELIDAGMQAVLTKPLDTDALEDLLANYLGLTLSAPARPDTTAPRVDDELPVIDEELGVTLAGGRQELAERMLEGLLESLDDSEAELRDSYSANDTTAFLDAVHHLNGACRYCGVPQLALVAETLESRLRAQGIEAVDDVFVTLLEAMQRLRDWQATQA
ncbi:ATP-binding protein [Halomonas sp. HP20-15]|uniref:ATP-binding protein n=1 Tax=Halomonas sp. HP20-15 TaxID=3085901 RepID=UPI0029812785|nr:ATP-binding protein [Halomonas sp. HP20-15]MDW5375735.1 ATP-binding protein [Halomonas sp. HP20-15]